MLLYVFIIVLLCVIGLNGGAGGIWDFMSGSLSPSPSPVFSSSMVSSSSGDLARLLRDLDEAKKKIKQWEDAWHQVKQVRDKGLIFQAELTKQMLLRTSDSFLNASPKQK